MSNCRFYVGRPQGYQQYDVPLMSPSIVTLSGGTHFTRQQVARALPLASESKPVLGSAVPPVRIEPDYFLFRFETALQTFARVDHAEFKVLIESKCLCTFAALFL